MNFGFKEILKDFVALFYPRYCFACENPLVKGEEAICTNCMAEMPKTGYHLEFENPFYLKLSSRIRVKYVMAFFKFAKESRVQKLLHALKYKNQPEIGVILGRVYGFQLLEAGLKNSFDLILPVPLHKSRRAVRGYNQSHEFAKGLSEILELPSDDDLIIRTARTKTQTSKTRLNRWENVSEVFKVSNPEKIFNQRILLVDDVITTGSTLEACAKALEICDPKDISIACIAATQ